MSAPLSRLGYRHQRVQRLRRLFGRRSTRLAEGCFVVEGAKVLGEAVASGAPVESVYLDPGAAGIAEQALAQRCLEAGARVFDLDDGVLVRVAGTVNPQPVVAVVGRIDVSLETLGTARPALVVVCAEVRDPGNAGTVIRSAEAAGADAVVFCDGAVDPYNPKTVRASAGALFHVPFVAGGGAMAVLEQLGAWDLWRWATVARGGTDYTEADLRRPGALVLGNEAAGVVGDLLAHVDAQLTIPMLGRAESLNVGMAAAVLCFEAARQRRGASVSP